MSIASEISRLQNAKSALKQSIIAKGVSVADTDHIDTYATKVDAISSLPTEIKEVVNAISGVDSNDGIVLSNAIAKSYVDTPAEREITTDGVVIEGVKDGVAYIDKIKGKTIVENEELISMNATSIQSKDTDNNVIDTHSFNISQIKDSNGETLFPYGLLSAGDVYDEINGDKAIKRIGVVDLGSLEWRWQSSAEVFTSAFPSYKADIYSVCAELERQTTWSLATNQYRIGKSTIRINYENMSDLGLFKTAMQGIILYYELETPIEVNLSPYKQYYKVQNGGTETLVAEGNTTPLIADIGYRSAMSAEELVTTLNDTLNN